MAVRNSNATVPTRGDWPTRRPRYTIVQISDAHVPADGLLFDHVDACARVQASVEMVAAAGCSPHVLVLSGDIANQGEAEAYVRLRPVIDAALKRFGAKLLVAPGNHDDAALLRAYLLGRKPDRGPLDEVVRVRGRFGQLVGQGLELRIVRQSGQPLRCRSWWRCANRSG